MTLEGLAADPIKKQYGFGLTLNQTLLDFGRTQHLMAARSELVRAANHDTSAEIARVFLSVEQAYYGALRARQQAEVQSANLKQRQETFNQAKAFADQQLTSGVDLEIAAANLSDAKVSVISAQNDIRFAFGELNNAMGDTGLEEYGLSLPPAASGGNGSPSAEAAMDLAVLQRPEVLSAIEQTKAADQTAKGVQSELTPRLDAIASLGAINPSPLISKNQNYAVGVALTIPIFTGGFMEGRISEEASRRVTAAAQEKAVRETVRLQAARAWLDVQTRMAQIAAAEDQAKAANRSLDLASQRYRLQLSSIVELTEAESLATKANAQLVDSRFSLFLAEATLAWATGSFSKNYSNLMSESLRR